MENENKSTPAKAHEGDTRGKGKQRKHKSYFMTPNEGKDTPSENRKPAQNTNQPRDGKPTTEQKPVQGKPQETQTNHNNPQRSNNHHHKNKHRHSNGGNPPSTHNEPKEIKEAKIQEPIVQNEVKHPAGQSSKNSRNRNRRKRHSGDTPKEISDAPSSATNEPSSSSELNVDLFTTTLGAKKADKLERPASKKLEKFSSTEEFKKYSEYEEFSYSELYGDKKENSITTVVTEDVSEKKQETTSNEPTVEVVGIRFKASGKTYYFAPSGITLRTGSHAIVETARGLEYGEVAIGNTQVLESETVPPLRPVVRAATPADTKHHQDNKNKEDDAFRICNEKIIEHELDMKLIDAQYTFDNSKLLFYFTSAGRVDFRNLVKDLAGVFRTRIELRQIGIRDEAKMVGGLGLCGRPLCCSLFLTDFGQVSIKMAKEQNLSLNSSKISGICGRLMCCLRYEHETYEYEIKHTPPVDTLVRTVDGVGVITEISPLAGTVKVRLNDSPEVAPKAYHREDITILKKKKES